MQTFLPYPNYTKSMRCLDNKRLGNQVYRECKTLINGNWRNHPASKMWRGYEFELCKYALAGLFELWRRGRFYPDHFRFFLGKLFTTHICRRPKWFGNPGFHASHRSNLLRKDEFYAQYGWIEPKDLPYVWG